MYLIKVGNQYVGAYNMLVNRNLATLYDLSTAISEIACWGECATLEKVEE